MAEATACPDCGTELAPALLACPACLRLVHAESLRQLAAEAEATAEPRAALVKWRRALELLPPGSRQHEQVRGRVVELSRRVEQADRHGPPAGSVWARVLGPLGVAGLLLWKFKFALGLLLTKGKLLLAGLANATTLFSMLLSLGVYWVAWGWRFAAGVLAAMYVHEMGHVFALQRFGIRATAPMFVPGLGAFVRLDQYPQSPREDARVGLAGPLWGLGASAAAWGLGLATGAQIFVAVAVFSAWLNLFNLLPVWQLDGGRGFRALSRGQRFAVAAATGAMWSLTHEGLLLALLAVALLRAVLARGAAEADHGALAQFLVLVVALALLAAVPVGPS